MLWSEAYLHSAGVRMPARLLPDIQIDSGQTDSSVIDLWHPRYHHLTALTFISPTTLPETVTIHVAAKLAGTYQPLQSDGLNVTLPAAVGTVVKEVNAMRALKLVASGATAGDRTFQNCGGEAIPT